MDVPFSEEQIKKLNDLARLPAEQQRTELAAFLKTLSPEQIRFLQQQQQFQAGSGETRETSCPFCLISQNKVQSVVLYDDDKVMAVLDIRPATKGHTLVFPKEHKADFGSLSVSVVQSLFTVAHKLGSVLEDVLQCAGSNLFVANGRVAGQTVEHVLVHVIPRYEKDGLSFQWEGKQADTNELQQLQQQVLRHLSSHPLPAEVQQPTIQQQESSVDTYVEEEPAADF